MSTHAGIFHRDLSLASLLELEICIPFLERLGPEGGNYHVHGPVAFIYRAYHVTAESYEEKQPHVDHRGLVSTWDGRLDNREDLALQLREDLPANMSDAAYAHAAFARWGSDAFSRLLGEWGMAVWNAHSFELSLALDYSGTSPLFYYLTPKAVMWSSELEAVVEMARERGLPLTIDEGWIAGFLARGPEPAETLYREIRKVEPGYMVSFGSNSFKCERHSFFDTRTVVHYRTDAEYEEHFRFLFRQAVACRLRSIGPIVCHVSGGLDSSSVAAMATDIVRGEGPSVKLETISSVYDDTPASDESEYIRLMDNWLGLPSHLISESDYPALTPADLGYTPASPSSIDVFAASQKAIRRQMEACGSRVQLSGEGGDEVLGNVVGGALHLRELLHQRSWSDIPPVLLRWSLATKQTQWRTAYDVLLSMLPGVIEARLDSSSPLQVVGSAIRDDFKRRNRFFTRLHKNVDPFGFATFSQQTRSVALCSVTRRVSGCAWRRIGPMTPAYPMLDRRLIAYLLAIPIDQIARAGSPRSLQRRAFRTLLPPKLIMRRSKCSPDAAVYKRFLTSTSFSETLGRSALVCEYGIADPAKLSAAVDGVRRGTYPVTLVTSLLQLELWLRHTNHHKLQWYGKTVQIQGGKEVTI